MRPIPYAAVKMSDAQGRRRGLAFYVVFLVTGAYSEIQAPKIAHDETDGAICVITTSSGGDTSNVGKPECKAAKLGVSQFDISNDVDAHSIVCN